MLITFELINMSCIQITNCHFFNSIIYERGRLPITNVSYQRLAFNKIRIFRYECTKNSLIRENTAFKN